jgi:hypothetical protein
LSVAPQEGRGARPEYFRDRSLLLFVGIACARPFGGGGGPNDAVLLSGRGGVSIPLEGLTASEYGQILTDLIRSDAIGQIRLFDLLSPGAYVVKVTSAGVPAPSDPKPCWRFRRESALRRQAGWRAYALVIFWIGIIESALIVIFNFRSHVLDLSVFGWRAQYPSPWAVIVAITPFWALAIWQAAVLMRKEVRELFESA